MTTDPASRLLLLLSGTWAAQITAALAHLHIPDHLAAGPRSADDLGAIVGIAPERVHRLLRAAAYLGLVTQTVPRTYALTDVGGLLREGVVGSRFDTALALTAPAQWQPWSRFLHALQTGEGVTNETLGMDFWSYHAAHPEQELLFARAMGNTTSMTSAAALKAYDFSSFERVIDVGGSQGVFLASILRAAPQARGVLFDQPGVIEAGREEVARYGLGDRLEAAGGDFFQAVPADGDLYVLRAILHDWDDERSLSILRAIHRAARPGAKILIVEKVLSDATESSMTALWDLHMLVLFGARERTEEEYTALLGQAGFRVDRLVPTGDPHSLIEATRI